MIQVLRDSTYRTDIKFKDRKTGGEDNVTGEMHKASGETALQTVLGCLNRKWNEEKNSIHCKKSLSPGLHYNLLMV